MKKASRDVTEAELSVLQVLWSKGPSTRRQIADVLYPGCGAAQYNTAQKLLERLQKKQFVSRTQVDGQWQFTAVVSRDDLISQRVGEVVNRLCGGSLTPLLMNLVQSPKLSPEQLEELRRFVREQSGKRTRK